MSINNLTPEEKAKTAQKTLLYIESFGIEHKINLKKGGETDKASFDSSIEKKLYLQVLNSPEVQRAILNKLKNLTIYQMQV